MAINGQIKKIGIYFWLFKFRILNRHFYSYFSVQYYKKLINLFSKDVPYKPTIEFNILHIFLHWWFFQYSSIVIKSIKLSIFSDFFSVWYNISDIENTYYLLSFRQFKMHHTSLVFSDHVFWIKNYWKTSSKKTIWGAGNGVLKVFHKGTKRFYRVFSWPNP